MGNGAEEGGWNQMVAIESYLVGSQYPRVFVVVDLLLFGAED
jgi:hypothetical protein